MREGAYHLGSLWLKDGGIPRACGQDGHKWASVWPTYLQWDQDTDVASGAHKECLMKV